jgi:cation:H+ antiporter
VVGVGLLVLGARLLVSAATQVAEAAGVSDLVIGLTVVAVGTSLPELATSVIAAVRGEREMAIGNVVGSNVFNIGAVMGFTAFLAPGGVPVDPAAVRFDLPVMVAVAVALAPIVYTGRSVARWEAALLLTYFGAYVGYLLLDSADHDALPAFSAAVLLFVVPLTVLTLVVTASYEVGEPAARSHAAARAGRAPPTARGRSAASGCRAGTRRRWSHPCRAWCRSAARPPGRAGAASGRPPRRSRAASRPAW